jgi:long-chain acyl-CoA synthetase
LIIEGPGQLQTTWLGTKKFLKAWLPGRRKAVTAGEGNWTTLTEMFFAQARKLGERPFLWRRSEDHFDSVSWATTARQVEALARGLIAHGLMPGDRVLLVSENRPEWLVADLAIMTAGAITVPAYVTNSVDDHLYLLNDSGARMVVVSTDGLTRSVLEAASRTPHPPLVIAIEPPTFKQSGRVEVVRWDVVAAAGEAQPDQPPPKPDSEDIACIIYTSGTSGAPKGVMLPHRAILANCRGASRLLQEIGLGEEVFLSFLPLSHAYEHTAGQFFPISIGAQIYYAEGPETLLRDMSVARPTIMTAVPRLFEVIRDRILRELRRTGGVRERLFLAAIDLGIRRDEGRLAWYYWPADRLLDLLVRRKVALRFGGRLKALISGGAPLADEVGMFFAALGLRLLQGYGQSEAAPIITCNSPKRNKLGTVGPPLHGVELRIAENGEILVRGPSVMTGYWNDPAATAEALKEGWLYTGDVGRLDADGYLEILDRKKDIIVTSTGENIAPQKVEGLLTLEPAIAQAMVTGDGKQHLVALIVPAQEWADDFAKQHNLPHDISRLVENPAFRGAVEIALERVNRKLSPHERVRRFALLPEPFSVENGLLTPTQKIRRHAVLQAHAGLVDKLLRVS